MITYEFPKVHFTSRLAKGTSMKNIGILVGELIVGWTDSNYLSYSVYNQFGCRIFNASFLSHEDAINFAKAYSKIYREYFPLWEENPGMDIAAVARWTVNDGRGLFERLSSLAGRLLDFNPLQEFSDAGLNS